jgi:hypothetical protein
MDKLLYAIGLQCIMRYDVRIEFACSVGIHSFIYSFSINPVGSTISCGCGKRFCHIQSTTASINVFLDVINVFGINQYTRDCN